ncbi:hypothetical protein TSUD_287440 [Trifolium subterraneum]|uniref:ATP-dependent DNA helicase n=1 Tax=Trifolium subterraneum TaxID=3900 RepID=A0A2Z6NSQ2_TRISU|nr:hypothetical protein TSUD_287440 [Trifolium subterraneum]
MQDDKESIKKGIVHDLREMVDNYNPYAQTYRIVRDKILAIDAPPMKLKLLGKRGSDGRRYNLPTASEVAALIVGDFDAADFDRDVVVEEQSGLLKRISVFDPSYLPLQYPLCFLEEKMDFAEILDLTKILICLRFKENHQKDVRAEMYKGLEEAILSGDTRPGTTGKRIVLPSNFVGGARYMIQNYQDAMAICSWIGYPDIFITFTCNHKWPELVNFFKDYNLKPEDRPDLVSRIFKIKLDHLIKELKKGEIFGQVKATEIPDKDADPLLYKIVSTLMIHGPCDGYPVYRRRDNGVSIRKGEAFIDNRFVVPYNRQLLLKYNADINVEWCNQSRSIKYLFKYVNKGSDRVTATFYSAGKGKNNDVCLDEIKMYYDCRYLSACEAAWRIFSFDVHYREPSVERLSFHLENEEIVVYEDHEAIEDVLNKPSIHKTKFLAWFDANKKYPEAQKLTYGQFPSKFVWKKVDRVWSPRKRGFSIGRIHYVPPGSGEKFYLRTLLNYVKGAMSYDDIKTIENVSYKTFKDACYAMGLLDDDKEYIDGIKEAGHWGTTSLLRRLFVILLIADQLGRPEIVWSNTWELLSDDILYRQRRILRIPDLVLTDDQIKSYALAEIEKLLRSNQASLEDYPTMPRADDSLLVVSGNRLIYDELNYDRQVLFEEHVRLMSTMTLEQRSVFDKIMRRVNQNKPGLFFLYGYGGTGKTFIWRALSAGLRSRGDILLNVASSGIAALLLPGGRTTHSRFCIPLNVDEYSTCNIHPKSHLAELIAKARLIIWDEAPMMHKHCFEAVDRTLKDILKSHNPLNKYLPFGGKVVVFGGDFRQILPVIPKGTRQ